MIPANPYQPVEILRRSGWKRTEGLKSFPVPIQPHFHNEFPELTESEFDAMIGFQLWWINAPEFARAEMRARQSSFGPSAWTRFRSETLQQGATPEQFAGAIRHSLHAAKPEQAEWDLHPDCFAVTSKTAETASTVSDILADIDATIPQQIRDCQNLIRFIIEDRRNNSFATPDYRQAELEKWQRKIVQLTDRLNGKAGANWITPFDQRFTTPESFK